MLYTERIAARVGEGVSGFSGYQIGRRETNTSLLMWHCAETIKTVARENLGYESYELNR